MNINSSRSLISLKSEESQNNNKHTSFNVKDESSLTKKRKKNVISNVNFEKKKHEETIPLGTSRDVRIIKPRIKSSDPHNDLSYKNIQVSKEESLMNHSGEDTLVIRTNKSKALSNFGKNAFKTSRRNSDLLDKNCSDQKSLKRNLEKTLVVDTKISENKVRKHSFKNLPEISKLDASKDKNISNSISEHEKASLDSNSVTNKTSKTSENSQSESKPSKSDTENSQSKPQTSLNSLSKTNSDTSSNDKKSSESQNSSKKGAKNPRKKPKETSSRSNDSVSNSRSKSQTKNSIQKPQENCTIKNVPEYALNLLGNLLINRKMSENHSELLERRDCMKINKNNSTMVQKLKIVKSKERQRKSRILIDNSNDKKQTPNNMFIEQQKNRSLNQALSSGKGTGFVDTMNTNFDKNLTKNTETKKNNAELDNFDLTKFDPENPDFNLGYNLIGNHTNKNIEEDLNLCL